MTRILMRDYDVASARRLTDAGYCAPIARALAARGIHDASELDQEWKAMLPPTLLEGTRAAAERLALARERGEHVTIVADYDCDGATACAVAMRGLAMMGIRSTFLSHIASFMAMDFRRRSLIYSPNSPLNLTFW